jgi:PAS domain S-box-containing protein
MYTCVRTNNRSNQPAISLACGYLIVPALFLLLACAFARPTSAQPDLPTKRILILNSYGPNLPGGIAANQSMRDTIRHRSTARVEFYYEFQDNARIPNEKYEAEMVAFLKRKYASENLNLIVGFGGPALDFLLRHEADLFTGVPKLFYFHDEKESKVQSLWPRVTGVWTRADLTKTLDVALTVHPDTQRVIVVSGNSVHDRFFRQQAQEEFRSYEGKAEFTYVNDDVSLEELANQLAVLPPKTVVIYLSFFRDKNGNTYSGPEALATFAQNSSAPIYGISETYINFGIVGGSLIDFTRIGNQIGELTLRILNGENASNIPPQNVANVLMFDWKQLRRWHIDESKLPAGSIVKFRQPTLWEAYNSYIITLLAAIVVQTLLIAAFLILRVRRRQAEAESARLSSRLREIVSNVPGIVWETRTDPTTKKRKTTFISDYVQKMLGYTPEEWLKQPPGFGLKITPEEDRERVLRESDAVVETGKEGVSEFRWRTKDGRVLWVENHLSPIVDGQDGIIGLRGVALDVTDRKRAIDELLQSEQRFSKAFRANPQPMSLTTIADGRYIDVNDSFLAMSGYTREEVIGHTSLGLQIWETPERRADFIEQVLQRGSVVNLEAKFRIKNGSLRLLLSSAERLEIGGEECLLVASSDITNRKEAEEALVQAHDELVIAHEEVNRLKNQLEAENIYLQEELQKDQAFGDIVGQSAPIKYVLFKISQVAPTDATVLIMGETGTGKELVARAIHGASQRKDRPLIKVNCAALSATLIESELFGHEKGAFTGAATRKPGRFELANGGTLLLDEIGELPLDLQVKLLRVLQEGEFERVGGSKTIQADVRIIASTNRDLKHEVERGRFREDLWYRLNVFPITTPPLRDRRDDIPLLTEHFARTLAQKFGKQISAVSPASMTELCRYSWPGNIRELANVVERAVINSSGPVLRVREDFSKHEAESLTSSVKTLEEMEREHIVRVLDEVFWRIEGPRGAARVLGINPSTLRARMVKLGIQKLRERRTKSNVAVDATR